MAKEKIEVKYTEDTRLALLEQSINHINQTMIRFEKTFERIDNRFDKIDLKFNWVIGLIFTTFATTTGIIVGLYNLISKIH